MCMLISSGLSADELTLRLRLIKSALCILHQRIHFAENATDLRQKSHGKLILLVIYQCVSYVQCMYQIVTTEIGKKCVLLLKQALRQMFCLRSIFIIQKYQFSFSYLSFSLSCFCQSPSISSCLPLCLKFYWCFNAVWCILTWLDGLNLKTSNEFLSVLATMHKLTIIMESTHCVLKLDAAVFKMQLTNQPKSPHRAAEWRMSAANWASIDLLS